MSNPPLLRVIDSESGEVLDECPTCAEWAKKYNGVLGQLALARKDRETEARAHQQWPTAFAIFRYWQELTGHEGADFPGADAQRFWIVEKFLTRAAKKGWEDFPARCRSALRGLVASDYRMKRGRYADRDGPRYDDFERPFKDQGTFESMEEQDPHRRRDPTFAERSLIDAAREVSARVLERAELIRDADPEDPVPLAHLLLEVDRLIRDWRETPTRRDKEDA